MTPTPYPVTRHFQRYEHVIEQGYVTDKLVLDVGCSFGVGTGMMGYFAKAVIGIDPCLKAAFENEYKWFAPSYSFPGKGIQSIEFYPVSWENINVKPTQLDVVVAMEIIEHLKNPEEFLEFAAKVGTHLFLSTPLARITGPTDNPAHIKEYSHKDLISLVSKKFKVLETAYQTADLRIVSAAKSNGSSIARGHVVQMLWCKRK